MRGKKPLVWEPLEGSLARDVSEPLVWELLDLGLADTSFFFRCIHDEELRWHSLQSCRRFALRRFAFSFFDLAA